MLIETNYFEKGQYKFIKEDRTETWQSKSIR
jgi:hypothetical protein